MEGIVIETARANNGQLILQANGSALSSRFDPAGEAKTWVSGAESKLIGLEYLIVLGAGSGYHLLELRSRFPNLKILAISFETGIEGRLREVHQGSWPNIDVFELQRAEDLLGESRVRQFLMNGPLILRLPFTYSMNRALYNEALDRLLARDPVYFADWVRREPRLLKLFPLQAVPGGDSTTLFSIKDLNRLATTKATAVRPDIHLIRVLAELVK